MNRYKFRAWHSDSKLMLPVLAMSFHTDAIVVPWGRSERAIPEKQFVVMQSSGLFDRVRNRIYEADILAVDDLRFTVEFLDGAFQIIGDPKHGRSVLCQERASRLEIIGNIYQQQYER